MSLEERNAVLNLRHGAVTYTPPATRYLGAFLVNPTASNGSGFTEVTATGYARLAVTNNTTNWPNTTTAVKSNGVDMEWPVATHNWGTIIGIGIFNALTGGNPVDWFDGVTETINATNSLRIRAGQLQQSLLSVDDLP